MNDYDGPERRAGHAAQRTQRIDAYLHAVIVMFIVGCSTALRIAHDLDATSLSTVYGASLGYATGLSIQRRNGH